MKKLFIILKKIFSWFSNHHIVVLLTIVVLISATFKLLCPQHHPVVNNFERWMSSLEDHTRLADLSLPGSHDSCAYDDKMIVGNWYQCQDLSIKEQLQIGIRVFDLRIGNNMDIYHGRFKTPYSLQRAISDITIFLKDNPSEFILIFIKNENWNGSQEDWTSQVTKILDSSNKSFTCSYSDDFMVKDLRGKFAVIRRYGNIYNRGISPEKWPNNNSFHTVSGNLNLFIQDNYYFGNKKINSCEKWGFIEHAISISAKEENTLVFNFISATGLPVLGGNPKQFADFLNVKLLDFITVNKQKKYGVLMLDFVGKHQELVKAIINNNFQKE